MHSAIPHIKSKYTTFRIGDHSPCVFYVDACLKLLSWKYSKLKEFNSTLLFKEKRENKDLEIFPLTSQLKLNLLLSLSLLW